MPAGTTAVDNTATACGSDPLAFEVCGSDRHHLGVVQVLGESFVKPATLAVTGTNERRGLYAGALLLLGGLALLRARRRRPQTQ